MAQQVTITLEATFHDDTALTEFTFRRGKEVASLYVREHQLVLAFEANGELTGALTTNSATSIVQKIREFLTEELRNE
jgi:hypothetical protein